MTLNYIIFLLICLLTTGFCRPFRYDYTYHSDIDGWLKLHIIPATWRDAWLRCSMEGAVLASPRNKFIQNSMKLEMARQTTICGVFTGIHATFSKGDFFSIEGEPLAKMQLQWMFEEPDNADNNEDCIVYLVNGTIADVNCSAVFPYICYKKKTKDMVFTDCGTIDKGYELNPSTGNCYKFHYTGRVWSRAFMECAAEGAYLAIVNSAEEAAYLSALFEKNINKLVHGMNRDVMLLGFHDYGEHGIWHTIHGQSLEEAGYAKWQQGQPDNSSGEYCGAMFKNQNLDDFWCHVTASFACEKSPDSLLSDD